MSDFKVEVVQVLDVFTHPNADRLDIIRIKGWNCVVSKDSMKTGDKVVYIPIDSILPVEVETRIFGIDSKVKLSKSRVRTIKLRGAISQGLAVRAETLGLKDLTLGDDLTESLKITKFEPQENPRNLTRGAQVKKRLVNPNFHKYGGIDNFKNYSELFQENEPVVISEKIHGTHFRCGWVPSHPNTVWQKIKKFFNILPEWEFVYGSNNVQLQSRMLYTGFYDKNVYAKIVKQYGLKDLLLKGVVLHGEIYGDGIQKNYHYGLTKGEHRLVVFDLKTQTKDTEEFMPQLAAKKACTTLNLPFVPVLYIGPYHKDKVEELVKGLSILDPQTKIREGVVIQAMTLEQSQNCIIGRKILKRINEEYLLDESNTDFH